MTSYMTTDHHHHHHRRTASLPRFSDDGVSSFGGYADDYVFKVDATSPVTSQGDGDFWTKKCLTTSRSGELISGELISGGTMQRSPEKLFQPEPRVPPRRSSSSQGIRSSSGTGTSAAASKPPLKARSISSQGNARDSSKFRSAFSRETQGHGGGGVLENWGDSFRPFEFGSKSVEKMAATDDWKKEFLYHVDDGKNGAKVTPSGSGGGGVPRTDLVYSKTTTTRTRGGRTNPPPRSRSSAGGVGQRGCFSDSEEAWSWLEEQRTKLETRRRAVREEEKEEEGKNKIRLERQLERQRSEVEGRLLDELRAGRRSTLPRPGSDLRYRARSMDNVRVNPDECEVVAYSRFGPNVQRKTSRFTDESLLRSPGSLRSGSRSRSGLSSREPPVFGNGRRGCQTLPRDARLPGGPLPLYSSASLLGEQKKGQTFRRFERNLSTGSLHRRIFEDGGPEEEVILCPIGPGIQPLEASVSPAKTTLSRARSQHTPNAELERATFSNSRSPNFPLTTPTPDFASTLHQNNRSNPFHPLITGRAPSIGAGSVPKTAPGNIPAGINSAADAFQEDEVMVVEQALRPSTNDNRARFAKNHNSVHSKHCDFTIQPIQDGIKIMDMSVRQDQREKFPTRLDQQTTHEQQLQQLLMQQQQQLELEILERQKQLEQQQQQVLQQQQQLQKQLEQHRSLRQQLSTATQQHATLQQAAPQQFSYERNEQLIQLQRPQLFATDRQQFRAGQQQGQQLQLDEQTYDLVQQQKQQRHFPGQHQYHHHQQQQQQQQQQQRQQLNNQTVGRPLFDNHVAASGNRGFQSIQNPASIHPSPASVFSSQGHEKVETMGGRSFHRPAPEAHGEPQPPSSPHYGSPFDVFLTGGEPLSPPGVSGYPGGHRAPASSSRECRFEAVFPTYATPDKTRHFADPSRTAAYQDASTSGNVHSNGHGTSGFNSSPTEDRHHHHRHHGYQVQQSCGTTAAAAARTFANRPHPIRILPMNGQTPVGDGMISPESYWIHGSTPDSVFDTGTRFHEVDSRKNITGGASSVDGSLTPLSVDVNRTRWNDVRGQSSSSFFADRSSAGSLSSSPGGGLDPTDHVTVKFVTDASRLWYQPQIGREEVISSLKNRPVGSFLIRDSNTYPGSFALAVKVAAVPDNAPTKKYREDSFEEDLVRHFLIETTPAGVHLAGHQTEPVFANLDSFVYQHSIVPLSLPCRLILPTFANDDSEAIIRSLEMSPSTDQTVHCEAFTVLYIASEGIELLSGPEAVDRTTTSVLEKATALKTTVVSMKISPRGVTITDNKRCLFFRQHFPAELIRYCGVDRRLRCWTHFDQQTGQITKNKIFAIICRRSGSSVENECHLFAEMDASPSSSGPILNFINQMISDRDNRK